MNVENATGMNRKMKLYISSATASSLKLHFQLTCVLPVFSLSCLKVPRANLVILTPSYGKLSHTGSNKVFTTNSQYPLSLF